MALINNMDHQWSDGHSTQMEFHSESDFQLDSTIVDVYLVSSLDRNSIIRRPVVALKRLNGKLYSSLEAPGGSKPSCG